MEAVTTVLAACRIAQVAAAISTHDITTPPKSIKTIPNHQVRTDICVLVDWWEHVWATDYQWDKERYLDNIWKIIDWDVCNERL